MFKVPSAAKVAVVGVAIFGAISLTNTSHAAADSLPGSNKSNYPDYSQDQGSNNHDHQSSDGLKGQPFSFSGQDDKSGKGDWNKPGDDNTQTSPSKSDDTDKAPCPTSGDDNQGKNSDHDGRSDGDKDKAPCPTGKQDTNPPADDHKQPCPTQEPPKAPCPPEQHEHKAPCPPPVVKPCPPQNQKHEAPCPPQQHKKKDCPKPQHHKKDCPPVTPPEGGKGGGPLPTTPEAPVTPAAAPVAPAAAQLSNTGFNVQVTSIVATVLLAAAGFVATRRTATNEQ